MDAFGSILCTGNEIRVGKTFWNAVVYASEYMEIGHSSYIRDFVVLIFAKLAIGIHVFVLIVLST